MDYEKEQAAKLAKKNAICEILRDYYPTNAINLLTRYYEEKRDNYHMCVYTCLSISTIVDGKSHCLSIHTYNHADRNGFYAKGKQQVIKITDGTAHETSIDYYAEKINWDLITYRKDNDTGAWTKDWGEADGTSILHNNDGDGLLYIEWNSFEPTASGYVIKTDLSKFVSIYGNMVSGIEVEEARDVTEILRRTSSRSEVAYTFDENLNLTEINFSEMHGEIKEKTDKGVSHTTIRFSMQTQFGQWGEIPEIVIPSEIHEIDFTPMVAKE